MAGTLAFAKIIIMDIFRNRGRTLSSIIGVVLAVSLITGQNIALDTTARDVLNEELSDYEYDLVGFAEGDSDNEEVEEISDSIMSIDGIKDVTSVTQTAVRLEIHNENTIIPPKYGFYERRFDIQVPEEGTLWFNTTLEQIPPETFMVYGNVYSQDDGSPIKYIMVETWEGSNKLLGYSEIRYTDENGYYEFHLPRAQFTIQVAITESINNIYSEKILKTELNVSSDESKNRVDFFLKTDESSELYGNIFEIDSENLYNDSMYIRFKSETENDSCLTEYNYVLTTTDNSYKISLVPGEFIIEMDPWKWGWTTNFYNVDVIENTSSRLNLSVYKMVETNVTIKGYLTDSVTGGSVPSSTDIWITGIDEPYSNISDAGWQNYYEMNVVPGNISVMVTGAYDYMDREIFLFTNPGDVIWQNISLTPISSTIRGIVYTTKGEDINDVFFSLEGTDYIRITSNHIHQEIPPGNYTVTFDGEPDEDIISHNRRELTFYEVTDSAKETNFFQEEIGFEIKNGSFAPNENEIVITNDISYYYNLRVGDSLHLLYRYGYKEVIWTFNVSGIIDSPNFFDNRIFRIGNPYSLFLNEIDFNDFMDELDTNEVDKNKVTRFYINLDRDRIIDPLSRESTDFTLTRLLTKINSITRIEYNVHVNNLIDRPLNRYYNWFEGYRLEMLAYSLPVIAVGFYLGMVGVELATSQKRRSLGIIKSRGASNKQVFTSLIMESAVLGIIAGAVGIVLGVVVSRFFLTIVPGARNLSSDLDFLRLNISATSIIWGILFAVLLLVMASIRPAKRISKTPIIESIHQHTEFGKKQEYKKGLDIFLVSFAIFAFIVVSEINLDDIDFSKMGQVFTILIFLSYIGSVIWLPFSPFFLMFSLTRLLTRGTDKVYKFFSRAVKPFSKDLWYIIHKNLTKNPKKVSMVSIIIALALGFGVFMTAMIGTTINGQELEAKAKIGGDLKVETDNVNKSFETMLEEIPGVRDTVAVNYLYGYMISGDELMTNRVVFFDSIEYRDHIDVDGHFFIEGNSEDALRSLANGKSVIIGEEIAQIYSLHLGDVMRIEDPYLQSSAGSTTSRIEFQSENFKVVGIVRALPGLEIPADEPDYYVWGQHMYIDQSAILGNVSTVDIGWRFLVDVKGDSEEVELAIQNNFPSRIRRTENLKVALDDINNNLSSRSVLYLMFVNIGFMIIIITVGLALIMFISIGERKNEFATIMARGAEGKQMFVLIVGEALAITMVGIVVGVFSGLFTAYTFNRMLSSNTLFGISGSTLSDRSLVVPWYTILIIILAILALFVTSLIAAYKVKRIKLHSALRIRGG